MSRQQPMPSEREARFDAELARAARALVQEDLPRGVLDTEFGMSGVRAAGVRGWRGMPAFAGVGALLVLLFVAAIALVPGGLSPAPSTPQSPSPASASPASPSPAASPTGVFLKTLDIRGDLMFRKYACVGSQPVASILPGPDPVVRVGTVCTAPAAAGPFVSTVSVGEAADGQVVEVRVTATFTGPDTPAGRAAIATSVSTAIGIAVADSTNSKPIGEWVVAQLPLLEPGGATVDEQLGVSLQISRGPGGDYELVAHPA